MHYIVSKKQWRRNQTKDHGGSFGIYKYPGGLLLDITPTGKEEMCCLGFCALQKGATKEQIRGAGLPSGVNKFLPGLNERRMKSSHLGSFKDTPLSAKAYRINDSADTTDSEKIEALTKLFKKHRHTIEFVD